MPRISTLSRKVAGNTTEEQPICANIEKAIIVLALDGGRNYSERSLERYLTLAWNSGAQPLVVLNKSDLNEGAEEIKAQAELIAPGVEVLLTSAETGAGVDILRQHIPPGETAVFIGPSGVGKSALTNRLLGRDDQKTGANRQSDKKGRHTTTCAKMYPIPQGGWLIDSPGLKELQLWGEQESLESVFQEITDLSQSCRFNDCAHQGEPGCAVQQALESGELDQHRYLSYLDLKKELAYLETRQSERGRKEMRSKGKQISVYIRQLQSGKAVY